MQKIRLALAAAVLSLPLGAQSALELHVSGEAREEVNTLQFLDRYQSLAGYLGGALGTEVKLVVGRDLSRDIQKMRAGMYQVLVGPAHVIGAATRYGYEPVARFAGEERAVFVASAKSGVTTLAQARGKRLALPPTDSLGTYLARGELNAQGVVARSHFSEIREFRYHEVALLALSLGQADVAVADAKLAADWVAKNGGRILLETRATPGIGVAVNAKLDRATKERLRAAFLSPGPRAAGTRLAGGLELSGVRPISATEYEYVSTLGYFTPRDLPGAKLVTAVDVAALLKAGATLYDTRSQEEYASRHIQGAKHLPYKEKSHKEVGFDAKADAFDVSRLPADRDAALVFACNGAECWKSYKASVAALGAGYRRVHWFRGGFPEWSLAGLPTATAPVLAQKQ